MNTLATASAARGACPLPVRLLRAGIAALQRIPDDAIALLGRFSIAAVFWKSGQTKVQGFAIDIVNGEFQLGLPQLSDSVVALFRDGQLLPNPKSSTTFLAEDRIGLMGDQEDVAAAEQWILDMATGVRSEA